MTIQTSSKTDPVSCKRLIFYISFLLITSLCLFRCANPVSPEGGPKDIKPPHIKVCAPPNSSALFKGNTIRIDFDEFINLKNPLNEIIFSPLLNKLPDYRLRGKSLIIKLEDSLRANTTYSINFGNAINDITENNVLNGFTYVFSTGSFVDSLSIHGKVVSAFDLQPQKEVFAVLYLNNCDTLPFDSLPFRLPPFYLTKTNEKGEFHLTNLRKADYMLLAVVDQNNDFIFNQPSEKIGFLDSLIQASFILTTDSVKSDSSKTVKKDTLMNVKPNFPIYELHLFDEPDSIQRILKINVPRRGMIMILFKYPVRSLQLDPLNLDSITPWCREEFSAKKDSLILWLMNPEKDSLILSIMDRDSILDTARIDLKIKNQKRKSDKKEAEADRLGVRSNAGSNAFNQFKSNLSLQFSYPLLRWDFSKVLLIDGKDTLNPKIKFSDSIHRKIQIHYPWKEEKTYTLFIPDSCFFGINQLTNDTLIQTFRTKAAKEYGSLVLSIAFKDQSQQYLVQLLTEKESLVEEKIMNQSGKVKFEYLNPGTFKIKVISDRNRNQQWDTGNYRKKLQPEEVNYFFKPIEIRANWDVEESWEM